MMTAEQPTFMQKIVQERGGAIRFIRAEENGMACWFYLRIDPTKLPDYEAALKNGEMDIRDFGQILESDWGAHPPADVVRFMKDTYGFETPKAS